jgi:hypothetical protein
MFNISNVRKGRLWLCYYTKVLSLYKAAIDYNKITARKLVSLAWAASSRHRECCFSPLKAAAVFIALVSP